MDKYYTNNTQVPVAQNVGQNNILSMFKVAF